MDADYRTAFPYQTGSRYSSSNHLFQPLSMGSTTFDTLSMTALFDIVFLLYATAGLLAFYWTWIFLRGILASRSRRIEILERRRRAGIPDDDKRPFNIAYVAATQKRRKKEEARILAERQRIESAEQKKLEKAQVGRAVNSRQTRPGIPLSTHLRPLNHVPCSHPSEPIFMPSAQERRRQEVAKILAEFHRPGRYEPQKQDRAQLVRAMTTRHARPGTLPTLESRYEGFHRLSNYPRQPHHPGVYRASIFDPRSYPRQSQRNDYGAPPCPPDSTIYTPTTLPLERAVTQPQPTFRYAPPHIKVHLDRDRARTRAAAVTTSILGRRSRKHLILDDDASSEPHDSTRDAKTRRLDTWGIDVAIDGDNDPKWSGTAPTSVNNPVQKHIVETNNNQPHNIPIKPNTITSASVQAASAKNSASVSTGPLKLATTASNKAPPTLSTTVVPTLPIKASIALPINAASLLAKNGRTKLNKKPTTHIPAKVATQFIADQLRRAKTIDFPRRMPGAFDDKPMVSPPEAETVVPPVVVPPPVVIPTPVIAIPIKRKVRDEEDLRAKTDLLPSGKPKKRVRVVAEPTILEPVDSKMDIDQPMPAKKPVKAKRVDKGKRVEKPARSPLEQWTVDGVKFKMNEAGEVLRQVFVKECKDNITKAGQVCRVFAITMRWMNPEELSKAEALGILTNDFDAEALIVEVPKPSDASAPPPGWLTVPAVGKASLDLDAEPTPLDALPAASENRCPTALMSALSRNGDLALEYARWLHLGVPPKKNVPYGTGGTIWRFSGLTQVEKEKAASEALATVRQMKAKEIAARAASAIPPTAPTTNAIPIPPSFSSPHSIPSLDPSNIGMQHTMINAPLVPLAVNETPLPVNAFATAPHVPSPFSQAPIGQTVAAPSTSTPPFITHNASSPASYDMIVDSMVLDDVSPVGASGSNVPSTLPSFDSGFNPNAFPTLSAPVSTANGVILTPFPAVSGSITNGFGGFSPACIPHHFDTPPSATLATTSSTVPKPGFSFGAGFGQTTTSPFGQPSPSLNPFAPTFTASPALNGTSNPSATTPPAFLTPPITTNPFVPSTSNHSNGFGPTTNGVNGFANPPVPNGFSFGSTHSTPSAATISPPVFGSTAPATTMAKPTVNGIKTNGLSVPGAPKDVSMEAPKSNGFKFSSNFGQATTPAAPNFPQSAASSSTATNGMSIKTSFPSSAPSKPFAGNNFATTSTNTTVPPSSSTPNTQFSFSFGANKPSVPKPVVETNGVGHTPSPATPVFNIGTTPPTARPVKPLPRSRR